VFEPSAQNVIGSASANAIPMRAEIQIELN
jgi:hypothetical protein